MLRRCLKSIVAQSYRDWVALVMDDSPEKEAEEIVSEFKESRICYKPNAVNLGCCGNLDQAFSNIRLCGGNFACVVEDDNWILPHFLSANIGAIHQTGCKIILRNQWINLDSENPVVEKYIGTTRSGVFGKSDQRLSPLEIRAAMFFSEGISNGGLFWSLENNVSLVVGPTVKFSPMQEYCRSLQIFEEIYFGAEPLAVFNMPFNGATTREPLENRLFNRGKQTILLHLLSHHGNALVNAAKAVCLRAGRDLDELSVVLADTGWSNFSGGNAASLALFKARLKGIAKRWFVSNPLQEYWASKGEDLIKSLATR